MLLTQVFIPQPPAGNKSSFWDFFLTSYVPEGIYSPASGGKHPVFVTFFKN